MKLFKISYYWGSSFLDTFYTMAEDSMEVINNTRPSYLEEGKTIYPNWNKVEKNKNI